ncbi:hypothetical protein BH11PLA1_BH11PLA1_10180 [soil metagenome]
MPGAEAFHAAGDEIVVAGRYFHTGTRVHLWTEWPNYDAYRVEKRFGPVEKAGWAQQSAAGREPQRLGTRFVRFGTEKQPEEPIPTTTSEDVLTADIDRRCTMLELRREGTFAERWREGGWALGDLQKCVDQFVIHYDAAGTSRRCFRVLHDVRGLSVHFMLDLDGTIYQTCDLKERTFHATTSNDRSIGIEIANIGAYADAAKSPIKDWYDTRLPGRAELIAPAGATPDQPPFGTCMPLLSVRGELVVGEIHGQRLEQYDLTPAQYDALTRLTATLCTIFPNLPCDYPRDGEGRLITTNLDETRLKQYRGLLGHYHIQSNKVDPGPAFQWDQVVDGARALMRSESTSTKANESAR